MNTKLLVNGKLVKGKGEELGVLDPATGKVIAQVHEASEEQITRRRQSGRRRHFPAGPPRCRRIAARCCMKLADRIEAEAHGVRAARIAELRQAVERGAQRRDPRDRRRVPFLRGRGARHARLRGRRIPAGLHQHDPPRSHRRGGVDRALELSTDDGRLEDGARRSRPATPWCSSPPSRRRSPRSSSRPSARSCFRPAS